MGSHTFSKAFISFSQISSEKILIVLCILVDLQVSICLVSWKKSMQTVGFLWPSLSFLILELQAMPGSASRPLLYTVSAFAFSLTWDDPIYLRVERGRIIRPPIHSVR